MFSRPFSNGALAGTGHIGENAIKRARLKWKLHTIRCCSCDVDESQTGDGGVQRGKSSRMAVIGNNRASVFEGDGNLGSLVSRCGTEVQNVFARFRVKQRNR